MTVFAPLCVQQGLPPFFPSPPLTQLSGEGTSHLLHQVAETRAYVVLLVCVSSHACTAQGAVSILMLVFACEEEGVGWLFSDS